MPSQAMQDLIDTFLDRQKASAGGVPSHWLAAPGADAGRVLIFLHGGGYEFGSLRSDGELAARLGRAST
jgi:monoterpene epsilon-lactone hydrolase